MTLKLNNGDLPATPLVRENGHPYHASQICFENAPLTSGLSKREHFAGLAMQALLSNSTMGDSSLWDTPQEWVKQMTETGVEMADALLKELSK